MVGQGRRVRERSEEYGFSDDAFLPLREDSGGGGGGDGGYEICITEKYVSCQTHQREKERGGRRGRRKSVSFYDANLACQDIRRRENQACDVCVVILTLMTKTGFRL
jgi:hypothetical protein